LPAIKLNLGGKRWTYKRPRSITQDGIECDGLCDSETRTIKVSKSLTGLEELDANIHEMVHATGQFLDEEFVDESSTEMARALFKLGYRKLAPAQMKTLGID
jgi:hypothetical protein